MAIIVPEPLAVKKLKDFLAQEIPVLGPREKRYFISLTGLFVFLFLLFFQPFGVNNYDPKETITAQLFLGMFLMGLAASLFLALNEFLIFPLFFRRIRRGQMVCWILWSLSWLAGGIFLVYNYLGGWHDFRLKSYFEFLGNVGALSLIPLAGLALYIRIRDLRRSLQSNHTYTYGGGDGEFLLVFTAENQKDRFTLPLKLLLFIESDDNYVSIHHLLHGKPTKTLFRKNLKSIQEEAHHPSLVRCHRSYLINLAHLQQVRGNRNKLQVFLHHVQAPIPVSRLYAERILSLVVS